MAANRTNSDQFQLRLPPGLRDRIKAHADAHGRSMNAEIIRVLEQEFPEPSALDRRIFELLDMVGVLTSGPDTEGVAKFVDELEEAVRRIAGRAAKGVAPENQRMIRAHLEHLDERRAERDGDGVDREIPPSTPDQF